MFALALTDGAASGAPVPLMKGFDGDAPGKPFGGDDDYVISADSRSVIFSARVAGRSEPWSTNFDVFAVPIDGSAPPWNTSEANKAWDAGPVVSDDGRYAAHRAMKRPGFEADRFGVMLYDNKAKTVRELDPTWDRSADALAFSGDGKTLYVTAGDAQHVKLFAMDARTGAVKALTGDGHSVASMSRTQSRDLIVTATPRTQAGVRLSRAGQRSLTPRHRRPDGRDGPSPTRASPSPAGTTSRSTAGS